jgi:DNA-directed RNA polymerase subunit RPC12/RpoP
VSDRSAMIVFRCSECGEEMEIHRRNVGEFVKCVECGEEVLVPERPGLVTDQGLSLTEWVLFGLLFFFIPAASVFVSSILY